MAKGKMKFSDLSDDLTFENVVPVEKEQVKKDNVKKEILVEENQFINANDEIAKENAKEKYETVVEPKNSSKNSIEEDTQQKHVENMIINSEENMAAGHAENETFNYEENITINPEENLRFSDEEKHFDDVEDINPYESLEKTLINNFSKPTTTEQKVTHVQNSTTNHSLNQVKNMTTFSQSVNENHQQQGTSLDVAKIDELIEKKERLSIKTNIYLKPNLVDIIQKLSDETNNSRSSVINKLIELGIKVLEK